MTTKGSHLTKEDKCMQRIKNSSPDQYLQTLYFFAQELSRLPGVDTAIHTGYPKTNSLSGSWYYGNQELYKRIIRPMDLIRPLWTVVVVVVL